MSMRTMKHNGNIFSIMNLSLLLCWLFLPGNQSFISPNWLGTSLLRCRTEFVMFLFKKWFYYVLFIFFSLLSQFLLLGRCRIVTDRWIRFFPHTKKSLKWKQSKVINYVRTRSMKDNSKLCNNGKKNVTLNPRKNLPFFDKFVNAFFWNLIFERFIKKTRQFRNIPKISMFYQHSGFNYNTYCKSNGTYTLQPCLSQNFDFVFTNLSKKWDRDRNFKMSWTTKSIAG